MALADKIIDQCTVLKVKKVVRKREGPVKKCMHRAREHRRGLKWIPVIVFTMKNFAVGIQVRGQWSSRMNYPWKGRGIWSIIKNQILLLEFKLGLIVTVQKSEWGWNGKLNWQTNRSLGSFLLTEVNGQLLHLLWLHGKVLCDGDWWV